nr:hypothetical protein [Tanacetum cinerariifolium]
KTLVKQAFWLRMSNPTSKPSDASPVKIEAPKELSMVILVNESLKKLKFHIARFDNVTEDLDTYDFDCYDILNAKVVLMANISNYGSDVISEVPHFETYLNDMENQSVHAMQDFE